MSEIGNSRSAPPRADAMLEALRGLGYSPATALADIIDNSISAGAKNIRLQFDWRDRDSVITLSDDGVGMTPSELDRAMRLGERNPLSHRSVTDLGRFGLGLKTASFSQCRALTVFSRKNGAEDTLRWDLDVLASSADGMWHLLEGHSATSSEFRPRIGDSESGTLVIWEKLDRIVTSGFKLQDFLDLTDEVEQHLSMVFHRYLAGPTGKVAIYLNDRQIEPWDPFLRQHPATWSSPVSRFPASGGSIEIQGHVLPHKDFLNASEERVASGPEGWTAQQGFYVYRGQRLLVAGSWLGLGPGWNKDEAHRLARLRLDIPNGADADWKIDIRKSTARPPVGFRSVLTSLGTDTRNRARAVFAHRGMQERAARDGPIEPIWRADHLKSGIRYRLEDSHPAIAAVLAISGTNKDLVAAMLRLIEETVPVQRIWLDTAEGKETPRTRFEGQPPAEVETVLEVLFRDFVKRKGYSVEAAKKQLLHTDPFQAYPDIVEAMAAKFE